MMIRAAPLAVTAAASVALATVAVLSLWASYKVQGGRKHLGALRPLSFLHPTPGDPIRVIAVH
jgi:hypothetical protein